MRTQKLKFTSEQRTQARSVSLSFQTILKVSLKRFDTSYKYNVFSPRVFSERFKARYNSQLAL